LKRLQQYEKRAKKHLFMFYASNLQLQKIKNIFFY